MNQISFSKTYTPTQQQELYYSIFIWTRRLQIFASSLCLLYIIVDIIRRKIYVYTSLKIFMWACIFYLIGMVAVLTHVPYMNGDANIIQKTDTISMDPIPKTLCGLQAFVNLFSYCIGYFFAIMVTLNIYQILNDKHRGFMKKILKNPKTIITLALIFIVYFLPFVFIYLDKDNKPYSYCPTGFYYQEKSYLLFCGLNKNAFSGTYNFLAPISVYFFPVILFFLHAILLFVVRKKSKVFQDYQYLNSKQKFVIYSGYLSIIVFVVQALNGIKTAINLVTENQIIIYMNYLFDLYPFALLYYYKKYLGQSKDEPFYKSTLITSDQLRQ